jgi:hypothetical protein
MSINIKIVYNNNNIHNNLIPWYIKNNNIDNTIQIIDGIVIELNNKKKVIVTCWTLELLYSELYLLYNNEEIKLKIISQDRYLNLLVLDIVNDNISINEFIKIKDIKKNKYLTNNVISTEGDNYLININNLLYPIKFDNFNIENIDFINIGKLYTISCIKDEFIDKNIKLGSSLYKNNKIFMGLYLNTLEDKYIFIPNIAIISILGSKINNNTYLFNYNYHIYNNMIIIKNEENIIKSLDNNNIEILEKNGNKEVYLNINIKNKKIKLESLSLNDNNNDEKKILNNIEQNHLILLETYFMYNKKKNISIEYYENEDDFNNNILKNKKIKLTNIHKIEKYKFENKTELIELNNITLIKFNPNILDWLYRYNIFLLNDIIDDYINNPFINIKNFERYYLIVKMNDKNISNKLLEDKLDIEIKDFNNDKIQYINILYLYEINNINKLYDIELNKIDKINNLIMKYDDKEYKY